MTRALLLSSAVLALCSSLSWGVQPNPTLGDLIIVPSAPDPASRPPRVAEWTRFESVRGSGWRVAWDEGSGLPLRGFPTRDDAYAASLSAAPGSLPRPRGLSVLEADRVGRHFYADLNAVYPDLPPVDTLSPLVVETRGDVVFVLYQQLLDGLPIEGSRFDLRLSADGHLLYFEQHLIPGASGAAAPSLAIADARAVAHEALIAAGAPADVLAGSNPLAMMQPGVDTAGRYLAAGPDLSDHLAWIPWVDGDEARARLVYRVRTEARTMGARWLTTVDARTGEILSRENEYHYADYSGGADAEVQLVLPSDPFVVRPLQDLRITMTGVGETYTSESGSWSLPAPDTFPRVATSALRGHWAKINDVTGNEPLWSGSVTPGFPLQIHFTDANSEASERDAFYHTNIVHDWVKQISPGFTGVDYEMPVNVNINANCNAFWDGTGINFYKGGGGCTNTAQVPDVVYHEYGHGDVQFSFAPVFATGSQHEGFADYHACSLTNQPLMGRGMSGPGTHIRDLDNDRTWPAPECNAEPHCLGTVIGGALWHMRENLIGRLGQSAGVEFADRLFHDAMAGRSLSFEGYMYDLLALDDDNGTLVDGTPHALEILPAFKRHNLGPGYVLQVQHTPVPDTEEGDQPIEVRAVFDCPAGIIADSCGVYYSTGPIGQTPTTGPTRLAMLPTGGPREFRAFVPGQPLGTEVNYWVSGLADTLGLTDTSPDGAPTNQHRFRVEPDATPPVIAHSPIADRPAASWPVPVAAVATDNQGILQVEVEWRKNGADQAGFLLTRVDGTNDWAGTWNGSVAIGDVIQYRLKATDVAAAGNAGYDPPAGYHQFQVTRVWRTNAEQGVQDVTHSDITGNYLDQWHLSSQRAKTGTHCWKFGDTADGNYSDFADGGLLSPSMDFGSGAYLSLWFWIHAEEDSGDRAWDAAVVEITTNSGASWEVIAPLGGYTHTVVENVQMPIPGGTPCWSGSQGWKQAMFDLASYAGQTARVRLRFASDGFVSQLGFYVDDLVLDPGVTPTDVGDPALPAATVLLAPGPNPFRDAATIRFALREPAQVRLELFDIAGRRVRSLLDAPLGAGFHLADWNGHTDQGYETSAGIYFVRMTAGDRTFERKVLRIR
ncbi:MAG: T9SS type A sorting domain-containing protein [Candidatus Eisenbacteria bacterium]|nr:T9SS type A sorting domain-containing protein [Candidatus Eisenbacteria bacterium]